MKEAIKRGIIVGIGIILQLLLSAFIYLYLIDKLWFINLLFSIIQIIITVNLIKNSKNYSYTFPLIIILLFFPLVGTIMYIVFYQNKLSSKTLKNIIKSEKESKKYLIKENNLKEEIKNNTNLKYLYNYVGYPITKNNNVEYYPIGEIAFKNIIKELKKAEKFIFLEYFIINHGIMWNKILEILKTKVLEGVEVRVMYDDAGCFTLLKKSYYKELENLGIKCVVFNKLNPISGVILNNRDHRKILIIDGKVAFSGGINLSDEYINIISKHGHWKDNAFKLEGPAVWTYTVMFLSLWNAFKKEDKDYTKYKNDVKNITKHQGYAVPYGDSPLDEEQTGEDIYLNIINQAKNYLYIFTPYLIIDTDIINSLILASKKGVDVKIIIPGVPDKKIVYTLTESYLEKLTKGGVKIYKYTPGFIHSKVFLSDDKIGTVGTFNLDYRSLYLHFECGIYLEEVKSIKEIKEDFKETLKKCHQVTIKEATPGFFKSIWQTILRFFAPLM